MADQVAGRSLSEILEGHLPLTANRSLIEAVEAERDRPLMTVVLVRGARLNAEMMHPLTDVMDALSEKADGTIDVLAEHLGAACEESWRLVSSLREFFDGYDALIPFAASTAASQVALGADHLVMGPMASLAPTEPVRIRLADLEGQRKLPVTADDFRHFIEFLDSGIDVQGIPLGELGAGLVDRLDPLVVGATEKARRLQRQIARHCLESHLSGPDNAQQVEQILDAMCGGLLSHNFPVTRRDCEKRLGLSVVRPARALRGALRALHDYYEQMLAIEGDFLWHDRHFSVNFEGFIDIASERRVLVRLDRVDERGRPLSDKPAMRRWIKPGGQDVVMNEPVEL
ncbi:MAG: hypothetical protein ACE366_27380 [Bradymonadia bacterium]